jgi:hypothetical protein
MTLNQVASTYIKSFDKLVDVMAQISHSLPAFEKYTELFRGDQPIQHVLCLFYRDILDFYSTLLAIFKLNSTWKDEPHKIFVSKDVWLSKITYLPHRIVCTLRYAVAEISGAHSDNHGKR